MYNTRDEERNTIMGNEQILFEPNVDVLIHWCVEALNENASKINMTFLLLEKCIEYLYNNEIYNYTNIKAKIWNVAFDECKM